MGACKLMWQDVPPPPGFEIDDDPKRQPTPAPMPQAPSGMMFGGHGELGRPTGQVHDGDTFRLASGLNGRLFGADAFELTQHGRDLAGRPTPIGIRAKQALVPFAVPDASVVPAGPASYGRPVVQLNGPAGDAGLGLIGQGWGVPDLRFLQPGSPLREAYLAAQRSAIASERGAYAGQYQLPTEYRKQGDNAPMRGKIPMSREDAAQWVAMMQNPQVTEDQIGAWLASRGQSAENIANIRSMLRQNRAAGLRMFYQQQDAAGKPVAPEVPFLTRQGAAVAEGVPDVTGFPSEMFHDRPALLGPTAEIGSSLLGLANLAVNGAPPAKEPAPEFTVKARDATGKRKSDEVGAFADAINKPKTGWRYSPSALKQIEGAMRSGDLGQTMSLMQKFAPAGFTLPASTAGSVAQTIDALRKHPSAPFANGPIDYSAIDAAAGTAHAQAEAEKAPVGGTEWQRNLMHGAGVGQLDERYAPRSAGERYLQAGLRALPSAVLPIAGEGLAAANMSRKIIATGIGGAVGSGIGGQAADDIAPGSPLAMFTGQLLGGAVGGLGARRVASREPVPNSAMLDEPGSRVANDSPTDAPEPPPGYGRDDHIAAMDAEIETPTLRAPREIDRLDVSPRPEPRVATPAERAATANVPEPGHLIDAEPPAPSRAGNINLSNLDSPQNIDHALNAGASVDDGFSDARRGTVSHAETERLAADMGMTADDLLKRRKGQALNAEQALAARQILAKSGDELVTLARKVQATENPGDELLGQFRQAWVRHVAIQEQVAGATAEAGRALSQFRMLADSRLAKGQVLKGLVDEGGGADRLKDAANTIIDSADDPSILNRITLQTLKPKFSDKLVELYYNSLLSGPQTHAVNVMGNTLTSLAQIPEHAIAAGIGKVRQLFPKQAEADAVLFSELGARATGLLQGTKEGLSQAWRTFGTGQPSDFISKVEVRNPHAISGMKGSIIRTPTRALSAEDELFKAMARRMELGGLAVRQAAKEGLRGDAARARASELIANPTDDMLERAFKYGQYVTFQSDLGPVGQAVTRITQQMPVLKLVLPFVKTPTNLLKFTIERSPAAPLLKEWRADVAAGGARRDLAVAKAMVGSGMMALVTEMVANGQITGGGPADENAKAIMRADGWQPYSLKIGDTYYSYQRMDPFASTIGIAADLVDLQGHMTEKQRDEMATLLVASTLKNLSNKTWLSGLTDLTDAINDPDRSARRFLSRMAGSLAVPAGVAQIARTTDPVLRDTQSELDRIRSRIPGLSQALPPKRDVWGQPIVSEGGLGPDIISPVWTSTARKDPVNRAMLDAGAHVGMPQQEVNGRKLSPQEYGAYREQIGKEIRAEVAPLVASPTWRGIPHDQQKDILEDIMLKIRRQTRLGMFGAPMPSGAAQPDSAIPPPPGFVLDH